MKILTLLTQMAIGGSLIVLASCAAAQPVYPNKAIRFIVPLAPGGATTAVPRFVGQKLTESWGQQVIVDNRPGGNSVIGTEAAAKATPDGYTLLAATSAHVVTPLLLPTPYDALRDFAAVATFATTEIILVVHPSLPVNNLQEFIALAKSKPGKLNYASSGSGGSEPYEHGSVQHDGASQNAAHSLQRRRACDDRPDRRSSGAFFTTPIVAIPQIKSGKIKAIAITGESRLAGLSQVPTFSEAGLPQFKEKSWYGILAPAGTAKGIIAKLSAEIGRILATPEFRENLLSQGLDPFVSTPEQFAAMMKADTAKYAKVVKTANIQLQ